MKARECVGIAGLCGILCLTGCPPAAQETESDAPPVTDGATQVDTSEKSSGLAKLIQGPLKDASGKEVPLKSLEGKIVGLYFSASWCPPCRAFSPVLMRMREAQKDKFEVILVGADRSEGDHRSYMKKHGMAVGIEPGSPANDMLSQKFGVRSIPTLVIIGPNGKVLDRNGRESVASKGEMAIWDWVSSAGSVF